MYQQNRVVWTLPTTLTANTLYHQICSYKMPYTRTRTRTSFCSMQQDMFYSESAHDKVQSVEPLCIYSEVRESWEWGHSCHCSLVKPILKVGQSEGEMRLDRSECDWRVRGLAYCYSRLAVSGVIICWNVMTPPTLNQTAFCQHDILM